MSFFTNIPEISSVDFNGKDLNKPYSGFIVFYASWCGYCQKLKPLLASLSGKVNIIAINCDQPNELCERFGVSGYPTITFFKKGIFGGIYQGDRSPQAMSDFFARNLQDNTNPPVPNIHGETYHPYRRMINISIQVLLVLLLLYILYSIFKNKKIEY